MTMPDKQIELEELILKEMDGVCSEEEFKELSERLRNDPKSMDYYLEFIALCADMLRPGEIAIPDNCFCDADDTRLTELCQALAEDERTAQTVDIKESVPVLPVSVGRDLIVPTRRKQSMFPLYTIITLTAALLLMIAYVVIHPRKTFNAVATLTGSCNAVWQPANSMFDDKRLYTGSTVTLVEGFAEITFDNQVKVIIQSPAEVHIEKDTQVFLASGKLSAVIPHYVDGFIVRTKKATVVDYGTEFGVFTDVSGDVEAHVFKGEVQLRTGSNPIRFDAFAKLLGGQAGRINEQGQLSPEITKAQPGFFVRKLPAGTGIGRPGHRLDLADIVGGGNGLGTGKHGGVGIDPTSGAVVSKLNIATRSVDKAGYHVVQDNPLIDGVFVPFGDQPFTTVSSSGHQFACPKTCGRYWIEVTNRPIASFGGDKEGLSDLHFVRLGGVQYGNLMHPAITMHSNVGITFNLDAVRKQNPGTLIRRFSSLAGLSDTAPFTDIKADLWVVVDGIQRFQLHIDRERGQVSGTVNVPIGDGDHFLTLIATDSDLAEAGDWTFFGTPVLELERVNSQP